MHLLYYEYVSLLATCCAEIMTKRIKNMYIIMRHISTFITVIVEYINIGNLGEVSFGIGLVPVVFVTNVWSVFVGIRLHRTEMSCTMRLRVLWANLQNIEETIQEICTRHETHAIWSDGSFAQIARLFARGIMAQLKKFFRGTYSDGFAIPDTF